MHYCSAKSFERCIQVYFGASHGPKLLHIYPKFGFGRTTIFAQLPPPTTLLLLLHGHIWDNHVGARVGDVTIIQVVHPWQLWD
jgi:hypothetical protein